MKVSLATAGIVIGLGVSGAAYAQDAPRRAGGPVRNGWRAYVDDVVQIPGRLCAEAVPM